MYSPKKLCVTTLNHLFLYKKRMETPLFDDNYCIQKMAGKGGWSYVVMPEIPQKTRAKFGWLQVRGMVDSYELKQYKLWTMKDGRLFLPLKADLRKKIKKNEGDWVHVKLFLDESVIEIPDEFLMCLMESKKAHTFFFSISESSQKHYVDWIYEAKAVETRVNRIAKAIEKLEKGLKVYQVEEVF